ncbi:MAG TPA: TraB/GumN family protein, partial [Saprospiraceae bacterium]|nr:TraB/GumN family protein [Saprospiraceae bacterium]
NIEGMVDLAEDKDQSGIGDYEDLLLNNRNRNWIPRIGEWMRKGTTLFAVGAGHLGGKNGVIRLLQKAGYKVTPVSTYKTVSPRKI